MNHKKSLQHFLFILISLLPALYLLLVWDRIPNIVPMHYDINFKPDRYGSKNELWIVAGMTSGVSLLLYFLLRNIHKIDPKRAKEHKPSIFNKLAAGMVIFCSGLGILFIHTYANRDVKLLSHMIFPLLGLIFIFTGNYIYSVKPNYFVGIRTPWALNDDENWRKTHRLGGILWFIGGFLMIILGTVFREEVNGMVYIVILSTMVLIPFIYSFVLFRRQRKIQSK